MDKILRGVIKYNVADKAKYLVDVGKFTSKIFQPESVFISCMDSRVFPSKFVGCDVGEIFFIRNAGNMVPHYEDYLAGYISSEGGAFEFGCIINKIKNVVVCGHSDCRVQFTMLSDLPKIIALGLMISYIRGTQGHYARNLTLNFLCTPLEMTIYVRDVPWDCSSYVICISGMAIPTACPVGKLYAAAERNSKCEPVIQVNASRCVGTVWQYIPEICRHNPGATIPDAANCGQYFDCSIHDRGSEFMEYLLECPYPTLYSTHTGACKDYRFVSCGERPEPKAPCEYHQYLQLYNCSDSSCPVCNRHHPGCVGLANGHHPVAHRDDIFIVCEGQRTLHIIPAPEPGPLHSTATGRPTTIARFNYQNNASANKV